MKTEVLVQMDGLTRDNEHVFVLAATNLPWELDHALLRRLEKRILVGLPSTEERMSMLERSLHDRLTPGVDLLAIATNMQKYSGCDVLQVAKEAAMRPLRRMLTCLEDGSDYQCKMGPVVQEDLVAALAVVQSTAKPCDKLHTDFASAFGANAST